MLQHALRRRDLEAAALLEGELLHDAAVDDDIVVASKRPATPLAGLKALLFGL